MMNDPTHYPPIASYALIGDCHAAALVSRTGSIDWCCLPRFDSGSCFGRLLDREQGGYCAIAPVDEAESAVTRRYLGETLVLETTFRSAAGEARLIDCFTMRRGGKQRPYRQLLRVVEGVRGHVDLAVLIAPRFDYGALKPWLRHAGVRLHSAMGGNDALIIYSEADLAPDGRHDLSARVTVHAGQRLRTSISYVEPAQLDAALPHAQDAGELDRRLQETIDWWRHWSARGELDGPDGAAVRRSAITLKALTYAPTGAIVAAPTTSLPERAGGGLNWDYRYSWIRDSVFSVRALASIGYAGEADAFRRFIERSAAGAAESLQIMYGVGGERRLTELRLEHLAGYRGARPVRIGNAAAGQTQLDVYGDLLELSWRWYQRGHSFDDDYWRFLVDLVDTVAERWSAPDQGIWEIRGEPRQFVYSKVLCWAALDRGIRLADACQRRAPTRRWRHERARIRAAVEDEGYDKERGVFRQAFGSNRLDAALLLLPSVDFVAYDDERMVRTVDAIRATLGRDGLLLRYDAQEPHDEDENSEGVFLACSFWLVECLAHQGRVEEARNVFERANATANDLGLFSEEFDPQSIEALGNFPQALTHLSHLAAAVALEQVRGNARIPAPIEGDSI